MDCQSAKYELESLALREDGLQAHGSPDVKIHLKSCTQCDAYFSRLNAVDQNIATVMNAVTIPADLQSNILARLHESQSLLDNKGEVTGSHNHAIVSTTFDTSSKSNHELVMNRRRWLAMAGTSVASLAAACSAWFAPDLSGNRFTLDEFRRWSSPTLNAAQPFHGVFTPIIPANRWQTGIVEFESAFSGLRPNGSGRHTIASIGFSLNRNRQSIGGTIMVTPAQFVSDAPQINYFNPGEYVTLANHEISLAAWTESDLVYACCVRGNERQLEWIDKALSSAGPA